MDYDKRCENAIKKIRQLTARGMDFHKAVDMVHRESGIEKSKILKKMTNKSKR